MPDAIAGSSLREWTLSSTLPAVQLCCSHLCFPVRPTATLPTSVPAPLPMCVFNNRFMHVQFEVTDTRIAFPLPPALAGDCASYCADIAAKLNGAAGAEAAVGNSPGELVVSGRASLRLPVGAFGATFGCGA